MKQKIGYEKLSGADAGGVMLEDGVTYGQILLPAVVPFVLRTVSVLLNPHK